MNRIAALPLAAFLSLAACGGGEAGNTADALENAAEQSDPAAAQVLENAADQVRDGNMSAQQAMEQAGNAQAATVPGQQKAPPSMQAQPNRGGQQTPPPKLPAGAEGGAGAGGNSQ